MLAAHALIASGIHAQGKLLQVANDPNLGLPFKQIQAAVNAAQDGDIIGVWEGGYQPVVIDGKSLTIINYSFMHAGFHCSDLLVRNLRADQSVVVRKMIGGQIRLQHNDGPVMLQQISVGKLPSVGGCSYGTSSTASDALSIQSCAEVIVSDCELVGASRQDGAGRGIYAENSQVYVYGTFASGGTPHGSEPARGGTALECVDAFVFMSGWALQGGCGSTTQPDCAPGGAGGAALRVTSGPPPLLQNVVLFAGAGGCSSSFPDCGSCGSAGPVQDGDSIAVPGSTRILDTYVAAFEGGNATLSYSGMPGEFVIYVASVDFAPVYLPEISGALAFALPGLLTFAAGVTAPSGALTTTLQVPVFPPEVLSMRLCFQAAAASSAGAIALSNPCLLPLILGESNP
jgi:hypothetical protein